jgi:hypothetical protein
MNVDLVANEYILFKALRNFVKLMNIFFFKALRNFVKQANE